MRNPRVLALLVATLSALCARGSSALGPPRPAPQLEPDAQAELRARELLSAPLGRAYDPRVDRVDIELPELASGRAVDVVPENVNALSALYFAWQLEEAKLFAVVDKIADHFMGGQLPLERGAAGEKVYTYVKERPNRLTEAERRSLYASAFGAPGAQAPAAPNAAFEGLWLRFLTSVASRRAPVGPQETPESIRRAGASLAVNLSLHGYGAAHFAALELQQQVKAALDILSIASVQAAYGARDAWQLVERVAALYLGGAPNHVAYRARATAGATIIRWLAAHVDLWNTRGPMDPARVLAALGDRTLDVAPSAERWLAASAALPSSPFVAGASPSLAAPTPLCRNSARRLELCRVKQRK